MSALDSAAELTGIASVCDMLGIEPVSLRWARHAGISIQFRSRTEVDVLADHLGLPRKGSPDAKLYTRGDHLGPIHAFGPRNDRPTRPARLRTVGNWSHIADALWAEGVSP